MCGFGNNLKNKKLEKRMTNRNLDSFRSFYCLRLDALCSLSTKQLKFLLDIAGGLSVDKRIDGSMKAAAVRVFEAVSINCREAPISFALRYRNRCQRTLKKTDQSGEKHRQRGPSEVRAVAD